MKALIMLYGHDSLFVFFKDSLKNFEIIKKEPEDLSTIDLIIILTHCWREGDPGIKFLDKINPQQIPTLIIDTATERKRKEWEASGFIVSDMSDLFSKTKELLKKQANLNSKPCPYDGVPYEDVPGYVSGYGCPFCKAIGTHHLRVPKTEGA